MRNSLCRLGVVLLIAALPVGADAQTWTWVGDGSANILTNPTNWSPTGTVDLNSTSTVLVFGDSGSYSQTPYLGPGAYQIGTLTITKNGTGAIFAGNGNTSIANDGLNIATAINFSPSSTSSTTSGNPIQTSGPIYLNGSNVTIGGTANSTNTLELGRAPGGGASIITSNLAPITKNGAFEVELGGDASGLGTINLNGGSVYLDPYAIGFQSNVVTAAGTTFGMHPGPGATYTYNGGISGNGGFTMNGSSATATVVLTGSNTYTGTTIVNTGTLRVGADNSLPVGTTLYMNSGTVFDVAANQTIDHFAISYDGTGSSVTIQSGKTLTINTASISTKSTYAGTISGQGALVINGSVNPATFTSSEAKVTASNTYAGGTTVNGGSLYVANTTGSGLGTGAVTVNNGGWIKGSGSFTGALTLNAGAAVIPMPALSVGATTFNGNSNFEFLIGNASGTAGTDWSLLNISGALTLNGLPGNQIVIQPVTFGSGGLGLALNFNSSTNYSWKMTTGASSLSGFAANAFTVDTTSFLNAFNGSFSVNEVGNDLYLNYTAVPEPAVSAALAGALALAGAMWRRKKSPRG